MDFEGLLTKIPRVLTTPNSVVAAIAIPGLITIVLVLLTAIWAERKIAGRVQMRYGPLHISQRIGGYLQLVADLIRITFQEPILTRDADRIIFAISPALLFTIAMLPVAFLPASPGLVVFRSDIGVLLALAIALYAPIVVIMIGWSANNKFAYVGTAREALITTAYEIPLILSVVSMVLLFGTADPVEIVERQGFIVGALYNPVAFLVYLIAVAMATSRFPFEIADYEGDVVLGPYTEYSSILFGLSMAGPYTLLYSYSLLGSLLFLGGWMPFTPSHLSLLENLVAASWTMLKALVIVLFLVFLRSAYPVLRLDQALRLGWKGLFVLSIVSLAISLAWRAIWGL